MNKDKKLIVKELKHITDEHKELIFSLFLDIYSEFSDLQNTLNINNSPKHSCESDNVLMMATTVLHSISNMSRAGQILFKRC